jgi:hypothetical protein
MAVLPTPLPLFRSTQAAASTGGKANEPPGLQLGYDAAAEAANDQNPELQLIGAEVRLECMAKGWSIADYAQNHGLDLNAVQTRIASKLQAADDTLSDADAQSLAKQITDFHQPLPGTGINPNPGPINPRPGPIGPPPVEGPTGPSAVTGDRFGAKRKNLLSLVTPVAPLPAGPTFKASQLLRPGPPIHH